MFCTKCGKQIPDDALFCNYCGAAIEVISEEPATEEPAAESVQEEPAKPKSFFEEFQWDDSSYPDINAVTKTEEIDFDWNADPNDVRDRYTRELPIEKAAEVRAKADILKTEDIIPKPAMSESPEPEVPAAKPEKLSTAERIDKFYTFNTKNEEFQQLLNREYEKIKSAGAIGQEKSVADERAAEKFESRVPDTSMDAFLEREGAVKPYEPKAFESDVLKRIEAQEAAKERARLEAEARARAIEEARAKAEEEANQKLEEERRLAEEARIKAEEEVRLKVEEEARLKAEEEARLKAEEEARLETEARLKAEEEARLKAEEEARLKAEEEARLKAEEEARLKAEEEARLKAEEEARLKAEEEARLKAEEEARLKAEEDRIKAEADLKAAQEAAKIRAQQAARIAAEEEKKFRAEQKRRLIEEEQLKARLEEERLAAAKKESEAAEIKSDTDITEHTTRIREDDAAKLQAAIAGFRESVEKEAPPLQPATFAAATPGAQRVPAPEIIEARRKTQEKINEMAKARDEFFEDFEDDDLPAYKAASTVEKPASEKSVTGRDTMLTADSDMVKTRVIKKADVLAGLGETRRISKAEVKAGTDEGFLANLDTAVPTEPQGKPVTEMPAEEDLLGRFVTVNEEKQKEEFPGEGFAAKEEPAVMPEDDLKEEKPGLAGTVVLPDQEIESDVTYDFDSYGDAEAENYRRQQANAMLEDVAEEEEEEEEKHGKGRIVLKVILILLIIIFAVELAGIGIKFLAPQSKAAELIDNQVEKILQLITGEKDDYSLTGINYYI